MNVKPAAHPFLRALRQVGGKRKFAETDLLCGQRAAQDFACVDGQVEQVHAVELFIDQARRAAEFTLRIKAVDPTVLNHDAAQAKGRERHDDGDRSDDPVATANDPEHKAAEERSAAIGAARPFFAGRF